jgi:hypothetical protein
VFIPILYVVVRNAIPGGRRVEAVAAEAAQEA